MRSANAATDREKSAHLAFQAGMASISNSFAVSRLTLLCKMRAICVCTRLTKFFSHCRISVQKSARRNRAPESGLFFCNVSRAGNFLCMTRMAENKTRPSVMSGLCLCVRNQNHRVNPRRRGNRALFSRFQLKITSEKNKKQNLSASLYFSEFVARWRKAPAGYAAWRGFECGGCACASGGDRVNDC
jgi:hypothetical protein